MDLDMDMTGGVSDRNKAMIEYARRDWIRNLILLSNPVSFEYSKSWDNSLTNISAESTGPVLVHKIMCGSGPRVAVISFIVYHRDDYANLQRILALAWQDHTQVAQYSNGLGGISCADAQGDS